MKELLAKLKKIGYGKLVLLLLAGITLLMLSGPKSTPKNEASPMPTVALQNKKSEEPAYYENRFREMLESVKGIGNCKVMLSPERDGVLIVTEGADDASIVMHITAAAEVIFGIPAHKVKVLPYN